jgi:hypothetical protein
MAAIRQVMAGLSGIALAGGIAVGASVAFAGSAQAAPCAGVQDPPTCRVVVGSFQTVDTSTDTTRDPTTGPSNNPRAKPWTLETTTTTTTTTYYDVVDVYHLGNGDFISTENVQTGQDVSTETSTETLNPGGTAPGGPDGG